MRRLVVVLSTFADPAWSTQKPDVYRSHTGRQEEHGHSTRCLPGLRIRLPAAACDAPRSTLGHVLHERKHSGVR